MSRRVVLAIAFLAALLCGRARAETLDEVVARHVEARGGREAWQAIESLEITGTYTAFSQVGPFTLRRGRPHRYRLDCHWNERPVAFGFDGETAWQVNPMFNVEWSRRVRGLEGQVMLLDADFTTPLFDFRDRGYEAELLGPGEVEGQAVIQVKLTRPDGFEEVWSLDPGTYLEVARDSPGSDFGSPEPQRTYFDDFRRVGGVTMPFYVESQWYTRTRVMEIADVELNAEVDDRVFARPPPEGMVRVLPMAGEWSVKLEQRPRPGAPWTESESTSTFETLLDGAMLREEVTTSQDVRVETTLSWDRFRERYVLTTINDFTSHMDLKEGNFDDDGRLALSNAETGTSWTGYGRTFHERITYLEITADGFKIERETSVDGGETWFLNGRKTYTRRVP